MANNNDIRYAISLARNVLDVCRDPPTEFSDGAVAVGNVVSVLDDFKRFIASQPESETGTEDFTLSANLAPCLEALQKMQTIRNKYDRRNTMGLADKIRWRSDGDKFAKEVSALHRGTSALRETVDMLQRLAARNAQQKQPAEKPPSAQPSTPPQTNIPQPRTPATRIPIAVTYVSVHNPPATPSTPTTPNRTPNNRTRIPTLSPSQTQTPPNTNSPDRARNQRWQLPICPNGSGCRVPVCFQTHQHPPAKACALKKDCPDTNCTLWHPQARHCEKGPACTTVGCPRAHPWPRGDTVASGDWIIPSPVSPQSRNQYEPGQDWNQGVNPAESVSSVATTNNTPTIITMISELSIEPDNANLQNTPCPRKYACPGGYNGECPLYHPRRQPCARGVLCRKGSRCTFDHSHITQAPAYTELPAQGHKTTL
ncbi:hypothetical protein QBC38DRAFT_27404 [Podospora fimiseda]|uniref:C3H1-type domain-containing protein n=1 Tax=Podospora fimiseda TaxID=252190 RepID=A0AAN7BIQ7_9PEZI|nr:hypothetical protein QBC38DRAFT_27404 [Podospora fimiseda]